MFVAGVCALGMTSPTPASADEPAGTSIEDLTAFRAPALPADPAAGIVFGEGSNSVRVFLPPEAASGPAQTNGPGQVVYDGPSADSLVQSDQTGLKIATVAPAAGADEQRFEYHFELPDSSILERQADGSVSIENDDGEAIATIAAPWAKDSTGRALRTRYTLAGNTLAQIIDTAGAIGNVMADPHVRPGICCVPPRPYARVWFTRRETESIYRNFASPVTAVSAAASFACGLIPAVPIKAVCIAAVNLLVGDFATNINQAHNRRKCLTLDVKVQIRFPPYAEPDWNDRGGKECRA